ncbi:MAG: hypothetical protein BM558_12870 [Roseobacter sp. MedPE-SW]|nr:MAG: hypothetical protein BM558_12870 [Roseobacter sp. MedPE-SW]
MTNPRAQGAGVINVVSRKDLEAKKADRRSLEHTFALCFLTCQFTGTADRFSFLARFFLGRLFEMLLELHFAEDAFTLQLFLQSAERLIDIVVTNTNLHVVFTTFLDRVARICRKWPYSKAPVSCLVL